MIAGIDVSNWQGLVNWDQVAGAGKAFAFCKASEGIGFTDRTFAANWIGARAAGLIRGAYHYALPSENGPEAEAAHFLRVIEAAGGLEPGDLLALDLEDVRAPMGSDLSGWALGFLRVVEAATGVRPLLYSGAWYMRGRGLTENADLAEYGLWLAAYQAEPPAAPEPWPGLAIWQHTNEAEVPGVDGKCDGNHFFGDVKQLRAYGRQGAALPPGEGVPVQPEPEQPTPAGARAMAHLIEAARLNAEAARHIEWAQQALTAG